MLPPDWIMTLETTGGRAMIDRRHTRSRLFFGVVSLMLGSGCGLVQPPVGPSDPAPATPPDFARALVLGNMAFDVTANRTVSNATLRKRYGSTTVTASVFSTVLPGDDGISRFMLLTDDANSRHTLVLAGTNTSIQWVFDALTPLVPQSDLNANVHVGWHTAAFTVYDNVLPDLRREYPITVTGFSLGAALSCIVSEYLILAGYTVDEVVTFGQPRLTDTAGVSSFENLPIMRFVNAGDPFPFMKSSDSPAAHFGPMVVLYDDADFSYVPANDPRQEIGTRSFSEFGEEEFGFHAEDLYRQRLSAKLSAARQIDYRP